MTAATNFQAPKMSSAFVASRPMELPEAPSILTVVRSPQLIVRESLAGIVTALALIPEVISFSFISGVDPRTALVASITLCFAMTALGGRPAMVTAAAGSVALVIGPMVRLHSVGYILPSVVLAGLVQIVFGICGFAKLARFIPRSVMTGFVNSLGILIFLTQVPNLLHVPWAVYPLFLLTVAIVLLVPRLTTAVPAPLIAIIVVTALAVLGHLRVPTVGGGGSLVHGLPGITPILVPLNLMTLRIIWPTALSVAFVGLMETLLTAKLVDELTETRSAKGRESWALGVANILAGLYGGVGGCAMIGQTVVNVKIGLARTRVSTAAAASAMLLLVTGLSSLMAQIPMIALAAVMMIVAVKTVNWRSIQPKILKRMPLPETCVMALTTTLTVVTANLALGVIGGVLLATVFFARRVAHATKVERMTNEIGDTAHYRIYGPLFFVSSNDLADHFAYDADPTKVSIDFTHAQIWDASSVAALESIKSRYESYGTAIAFTGLDERSADFYGRLAGRS